MSSEEVVSIPLPVSGKSLQSTIQIPTQKSGSASISKSLTIHSRSDGSRSVVKDAEGSRLADKDFDKRHDKHKHKKEKKKDKKKDKKKHKHKHRDKGKSEKDSSSKESSPEEERKKLLAHSEVASKAEDTVMETHSENHTRKGPTEISNSLEDIPIPSTEMKMTGGMSAGVKSGDKPSSKSKEKSVVKKQTSAELSLLEDVPLPPPQALESIPTPDQITQPVKKVSAEITQPVKNVSAEKKVTAKDPKPPPPPGPVPPPVPPPLPSSEVKSLPQSTLQASIRESMLKEVGKSQDGTPQTIVDDFFKDFLASKMKQIESEYKMMTEQLAKEGKGKPGEIARSVEEMNKLLDEELSSIATATQKNDRGIKRKSGDDKQSAVKVSKWDSKVKVETETENDEKKIGNNAEKNNKSGEKPKVEMQVGTKRAGKLQMSLKISQMSAEMISSGEIYKDAGQKMLEEGEVTTSGEEESGSDDEDLDSDDVSETGSLSDSDKETKSKKKKKKKEKKKKKKKHKNKDSSSETKLKRKSSHKSRSRTPKRKRSRSRERSRSHSKDRHESKYMYDAYSYRDKVRDKYAERERDRFHDRDRGHHRRDRDYYDDRDHRHRKSRSRSKSRERPFRVTTPDLRVKIDKAKLREIAIKNAIAMAKSGQVPNVDLAAIKSGGKSIDELTDFCKRISSKSKKTHDSSSSSDEELPDVQKEEDDEFIHHPFKVRDASSIVLNIRDSKPLPLRSPAEKLQESATLRLQFPVSSGSTHRLKESDWVPVQKTTATATATTTAAASVTTATGASTTSTTSTGAASLMPPPPLPPPVVVDVPPNPVKAEDQVFPDVQNTNIDIGAIISERLGAFKKLRENPNDVEAMTTMAKAQQKASLWAQSKNLPGKFIGSTGAQILSQEELMGPNKKRQAWAKKDQFVKAAPLQSGIGMALLQRMGWKKGEGLGKNNEGQLEPLHLDFKTDRRGLSAVEEQTKKGGFHGAGPTNVKDLSGKHPVSALVELCNRRKWGAPQFELVHESGPDHKKNFLFKVRVHGTEYQPTIAMNNKKTAKAAAATCCLQTLGLIPRDAK